MGGNPGYDDTQDRSANSHVVVKNNMSIQGYKDQDMDGSSFEPRKSDKIIL